jgi:UDPglucose--hexose-1-phosphate uridylyltransferase
MSQLRKDPVVDRWVIIASDRSKRPHATSLAESNNVAEPCPFCAGHEDETPPEVLAYRDGSTAANSPGWRVRVVPNKYPALAGSADPSLRTEGLFEFMGGAGVHEVIIENPQHAVTMAELSDRQIEDVLCAYRERITALRQDPRWQSILIYKNEGSAAGATLEHVHSQLLALPMIPRELAEEWRALQAHYEAKRSCLYCEIIEKERAQQHRMVAETRTFVAFCPFAARFPYETWLMPKKHAPSFHGLADVELREFASLLRQTLQRVAAVSAAPLNYALHSAPLLETNSAHYHWHLELLPRISKIAGFELASGYYINIVDPEKAAQQLRAVAR